MPWPRKGATQYHEQLVFPDKGPIKGLVVCNNWDLRPLDLLNSLTPGCYKPSLEVLIASVINTEIKNIISPISGSVTD